MSKKIKLWDGRISFKKGYDTKYELNTYEHSAHCAKMINYIFYHEFEFESFARGRSSVTAEYVSLDKSLAVSMFIKDVGDIINQDISLKTLKGYFCFTKKGANYGIKYLGKEIPESNLMVGEFDLDKWLGVDNE